ncbi:MAG: hypothetical protein IPM29_08445 [Planctomycetes bacterium]|nr:hypothetical protein [Planctomycetota bacterium]
MPEAPDPLPELGPTEPLTFHLGQAWRDAPEPDLRPAVVRATFRAGALHVEAELVDDDVFNDATAHNQATWELGDVLEVFARRDDSESYVEAHVTPDGIKLHLRFSDFGHCARVRDFAEISVDPDLVDARAERTPDGWRAWLSVPLEAGPGDVVRVSFCRYDATRGRAEPVVSSSSPHPVPAFHRPLEWRACRVVG